MKKVQQAKSSKKNSALTPIDTQKASKIQRKIDKIDLEIEDLETEIFEGNILIEEYKEDLKKPQNRRCSRLPSMFIEMFIEDVEDDNVAHLEGIEKYKEEREKLMEELKKVLVGAKVQ
jgi:hypothetical protein